MGDEDALLDCYYDGMGRADDDEPVSRAHLRGAMRRIAVLERDLAAYHDAEEVARRSQDRALKHLAPVVAGTWALLCGAGIWWFITKTLGWEEWLGWAFGWITGMVTGHKFATKFDGLMARDKPSPWWRGRDL